MKKTALVTGSSGGMGRIFALQLAAQGHGVLISDLDGRKLQALADEIAQAGGQAWPCPADLADEAGLRSLADRVKAEAEGLDLLAHCAGCFKMGSMEIAAVADFDAQYRVNLRAPYLLTQLLLPALKKRAGQVVFVNSTAALAPGPRWGAYSATKAGLKALADSLRAEVNAHGIRVLSVFPGRTATPMQEHIHGLEKRPYQAERLMQPEDVVRMVLQALNLPRTAEVTDLVMRPMAKPI